MYVCAGIAASGLLVTVFVLDKKLLAQAATLSKVESFEDMKPSVQPNSDVGSQETRVSYSSSSDV